MDEDRTVDRTRHGRNPDESGKWVSALIALLGAWMVVEAVLLDIVLTQFWNDVLVGALLLAVGAYNYYRRANEEVGSVAAASVAVVLGIWLIVAPFVLGAQAGATETTNQLAFWNDIVAGLIAIGLGAYSANSARNERRAVERAAT